MRVFNVDVRLAKQEDGLWRATVPGLQGCFVDAETMEEALSDMHEVVAMYIDMHEEDGKPIPESISAAAGPSYKASFPVVLGEHHFRRLPKRSKPATR